MGAKLKVNELKEKLNELIEQGYGNNEVIMGQWTFNYDSFSSKGDIVKCEIVKSHKETFCGLSTN